MKYQIQGRRPGTPQSRWRPIGRTEYDSNGEAQAWIDLQPAPDANDARAAWEYIILQVPE